MLIRKLSVLFVAWFAIAVAAEEPLRVIGFGSCANQNGPQDFWAPILAFEPEVFIFAGDNIYADTRDMDVMRAKYGRLAGQPGFQALKSRARILATWDDHDYGENDAGAEYPMKEESERIFLDFFEVPADHPRRQRPGIYDAGIFGPDGKRVQVILLDARYFRGPLKTVEKRVRGQGKYLPQDDDSVTMLGDAQWAWLLEQLREPAEIRFIVSGVQVLARDHAWESWYNLPHERERLFDVIRSSGAEGVIILSGDRHHAELSRKDDAIGYPLFDLTASGLNQAHHGAVKEDNRYRVGEVYDRHHFGAIRIDWDADDPVITLQIRGLNNEPAMEERIPLSRLR